MRKFYFYVYTPMGIRPITAGIGLPDLDSAIEQARTLLPELAESLQHQGVDATRCGMLVTSAAGAVGFTLRFSNGEASFLVTHFAESPAATAKPLRAARKIWSASH